MKACNIEWSVDLNDIDIYGYIETKEASEASKELGIPYEYYINMSIEDIEDYVYEQCHRNPYFLGEFIGLPSSVELPDVDDDVITEWLSDTYGFCVSYYELEDNE